jgi:hypothetical protein
MAQHEENSVLFSLAHLKTLATATASPTGFQAVTPSSPEPSLPLDSLYVAPTAIAPSVLLAASPAERPRWMVPAIAGVGVLFAVFLVLVIVLVTHNPEPQVSVVAHSTAAKAVTPAAPPADNASKLASALASAAEEKSSVEPSTPKAKEPRKVAKGKRGKRGKAARLARRAKRGAEPDLIASAAPTKKRRVARRDALDDLIDSAMRK